MILLGIEDFLVTLLNISSPRAPQARAPYIPEPPVELPDL